MSSKSKLHRKKKLLEIFISSGLCMPKRQHLAKKLNKVFPYPLLQRNKKISVRALGFVTTTNHLSLNSSCIPQASIPRILLFFTKNFDEAKNGKRVAWNVKFYLLIALENDGKMTHFDANATFHFDIFHFFSDFQASIHSSQNMRQKSFKYHEFSSLSCQTFALQCSSRS